MKFKPGDLGKVSSLLGGMRLYIPAWKFEYKTKNTIDNEIVNIKDGSVILVLDSWLDEQRDLVFVKFLLGNDIFFIEEHYLEETDG